MSGKIFLVCLVLGIFVVSANADCVLPLPRFRYFQPLIFSSNGNLLPTDNDNEHALTITIPSNEEVILSCAPNYFKNPSLNASNTLTARCKSGEKFDVKGEVLFWLIDLGCEVRAVEEILKPIPGCPSTAKSVEFGYENPIARKTEVIGEACYSETEGRSIFVHTKIIKSGNKKAAVLDTESANYLAQRHPDSKYKIDLLVAAQLDELNERLESLLSKKKVRFLETRHFIDLSTIQNGQLNSVLKLGWNFVVTNGFDHLPNYDNILKDILSRNENIELFVGTHSVLQLKTANGEKVPIHLLPYESKYPVPGFLWIVATTDSGKGQGFLISNDIDANLEDLVANSPCKSQCEQLSWMTNLLEKDSYSKPENGYVYCCELDDFLKTVSEMPTLEGRYSSFPRSNQVVEDFEVPLLDRRLSHFK